MLTLDLSNLFYNLQYIRSKISPTKLCIVCKCNYYGIGLTTLLKHGIAKYADYLAITENIEAQQIREYHPDIPILRIRPATPEEILCGLQYNIEEIIESPVKLQYIANYHPTLPVHLFINTGMNNIGIDLDTASDADIDKLHCVGIMTHSPDLYSLDDSSVQQFLKYAKSRKLFTHMANSVNTLTPGQEHFWCDMVRIGIGQYGLTELCTDLKPVLRWTEEFIDIRHVIKGETISYDRTFIAPHDMIIGIIPVGYHHGYPLHGRVCYVDGQYCKVVGKVTMNLIAVEINRCSGTVELLGENVLLDQLSIDTPHCTLMNICKSNFLVMM